MSETVECSECRTRYDSLEHPFCPRCGSTGRGAPMPGALASARRNDPARRRVQASGAVLIAVGGFFLLLMGAMLLLTGSLAAVTLDLIHNGEGLEAPPGGNVTVEVLREGEPLAGQAVVLRHGNGTAFANGTTDEDGRVRFPLGAESTATVALDVDGTEFRRNATAQAGQETTVRIDVARDAAVQSGWIGVGPFVQVLRIVLGVALGICALLVAAGIAALRLRSWGFAFTAGLLGLIPFLMLFVATLQLGFLLVLLVIGVPVSLIGLGRRQFHRPPALADLDALRPREPPREPPSGPRGPPGPPPGPPGSP